AGIDLEQPVLPRRDPGRRCRATALSRHDVDDAADGGGPVERRARASEHFDALDVVDGQRQVAVVMARLDVVEAYPVDQYERLSEAGAPQREVRLRAERPALADPEPRHEAQGIGHAADGKAAKVVGGDDGHAPADGAESG